VRFGERDLDGFRMLGESADDRQPIESGDRAAQTANKLVDNRRNHCLDIRLGRQ
jgi:hypothetical protein